METKANYVAVGVFVLVCVLGLVVALLWLGGAQYSEEYAYYQTSFTGAVTGLGTGTPVRYNGITVGTVSKLNFDPDDPKKVIVIMQLEPSIPLGTDAIAYYRLSDPVLDVDVTPNRPDALSIVTPAALRA